MHSRSAGWNSSYLTVMQMFTSQAVSQESLLLWRETGFVRCASAHPNVAVWRRWVKHALQVPVSLP